MDLNQIEAEQNRGICVSEEKNEIINNDIKVFFPIYYEYAHNFLKETIDNPPKNCIYITRKGKLNDLYNSYYGSHLSRKLIDKLYKFPSFFVSPTYLKTFIEKNENVFDADLIYAVANFYLGDLPWVIDCEDARSFYRGYEKLFVLHKHQIEKILSKKNCKKILPWTEKAKESILVNYNITDIRDKIEVVPITIKSKPINFKKNYEQIIFLFVGSSNIQFKKDFYYKGGLETIRAFQKISPKYDNISLIIRSHVDQKIQAIVNKSEKMHLINSILPRYKLEKLYSNSSVFVFPTFASPAMVFVEAMNYSLPIITTNYWANSEYVKDNYNGFLVDMPVTVKRKDKILCTLSYNRNIGYHEVDENQIKQISKRMKYFIENPKDIGRMGKNSKKMVEIGKYSIKRKNQNLKRIYEECLKK